MQLHRIIRFVAAALLGAGLAVVPLTAVGAQEGDTTSTTQLDLGGDSGDSTTSTTQLEVGGDTNSAETPPNRVDAGAGGSATDAATPLALIVLAGGLVVVTAAATRKMRTR